MGMSPVIVVPKKSAPDEPPRRRLCVDYQKVNALQPEVKRTDKGNRLFITLSVTKNRRDVFKAGRHNNFLYHRFTLRILPHRPYVRIQSQVSIRSTHGKMAVHSVHRLDLVKPQPISSC